MHGSLKVGIAAGLICFGGLGGIFLFAPSKNDMVRREIKTVVDNMRHPGRWQIEIDKPRITNNQSYTVSLISSDDPYRKIMVSKDRFGSRYVTLWLYDHVVTLKEGMCKDNPDRMGTHCDALRSNEWKSFFFSSLAFAEEHGATI